MRLKATKPTHSLEKDINLMLLSILNTRTKHLRLAELNMEVWPFFLISAVFGFSSGCLDLFSFRILNAQNIMHQFYTRYSMSKQTVRQISGTLKKKMVN